MPIGIVSSDDFLKEIESLSSSEIKREDKSSDFVVKETKESEVEIIPPAQSNTPEGKIQEQKTRGRNKGDVNVPSSLRNLISVTALEEGRDAAIRLAKDFGLSESSVAAYSNGSTSTKSYHEPTPEIKKVILSTKERITKKAKRILLKSFDGMTDDKIQEAKLETLSVVARNMSSIIKDMDTESDERPDKPVFVVMAPTILKEEVFDTIAVRD